MTELVAAARAAVALVLPVRCAGCGDAGEPWCRVCATAARRPPPPTDRSRDGPVPTWSATVLEGPVRAAVTAHKDDGREDLRPVLARLLATALAQALVEHPAARASVGAAGGVVVVPVPTAPSHRRRRGGDPVGALAVTAARLVDPSLVVVPALRHVRRVADQSGLDRRARQANLRGALVVPPRLVPAVAGRTCVLVDDVVTTGTTLGEGARALRAAGAPVVLAATSAVRP